MIAFSSVLLLFFMLFFLHSSIVNSKKIVVDCDEKKDYIPKFKGMNAHNNCDCNPTVINIKGWGENIHQDYTSVSSYECLCYDTNKFPTQFIADIICALIFLSIFPILFVILPFCYPVTREYNFGMG